MTRAIRGYLTVGMLLLLPFSLVAEDGATPAGIIHPIEAALDEAVKADSSPEGLAKAIAEAELAWDGLLNRNYTALQESLAQTLAGAEQDTLRQAQRAWVLYRDKEFAAINAFLANRKTNLDLGHVAALARMEIVKDRALVLGKRVELVKQLTR